MYATTHSAAFNVQRRAPLTLLRCWMVVGMLMNAVQQPRAVKASDDVARLSSCEVESIINQLTNPSPEYQLHVSALRNQLKNILRERQLAFGEEQSVDDYDYPEEDKRSVASLAAQGLLNAKRSVATLAKNGQLPTPEPDQDISEEKRYVGALARSGGMMSYGKRNVGTLARDFQLPHNGKRNMATLARLGLLNPHIDPKRNLASVARHTSHNRIASSEKRNLGALKGSPVHGSQQKREDEELLLPGVSSGAEVDYMDVVPNYWLYPNYADLDWNEYARAQKRFLGRVLPPTRATASTHRSRL